MKEDSRVSDILRSVSVKVSDFVEPTEEVTDVEDQVKQKKYTVKEEEARDRETGQKQRIYKVRDNKGNTVNDKVFTSKQKANDERDTLTDRADKQIADNKPFPFAKSTYKTGDILIDKNSKEYIVLSTPSTVEISERITIKEI